MRNWTIAPMSLGSQISPHLPFLRRYARLLIGSMTESDALVREVLETIVADPSRYPRDVDPRVGLYARLSRILADRGFTNLGRQCFLLTSVEGFSQKDAGYIVGVPESTVARFTMKGLDALGRLPSAKVMIVENEPLIAMDLEAVVRGLGHRVVGIAIDHQEAIALFEAEDPELILMDIELRDGMTGIDAVRSIVSRRPTPVIFVTAFPEQLLTGERPEPTFLVTKPFQRSVVASAISQALLYNKDFSDWEIEDAADAVGSEQIGTEHQVSQIEDVVRPSSIAPDVAPLPAPLDVEVVGQQLKVVRRGSAQTVIPLSDTEALRATHAATALWLCESEVGGNLGNVFRRRLNAVRDLLSVPFVASSGVSLGVQAKGLSRMLPLIHEALSDENAQELEVFFHDLIELAWLFPSYQSYAAETQSAVPLTSTQRQALVDVALALESQSDDDVDPLVKIDLEIKRVDSDRTADPVADFDLKRSIDNSLRAYSRYIRATWDGIKENADKSFQKTVGATVGTVVAVIFVLSPAILLLSKLMPAEFTYVIELAKTAKSMVM